MIKGLITPKIARLRSNGYNVVIKMCLDNICYHDDHLVLTERLHM